MVSEGWRWFWSYGAAWNYISFIHWYLYYIDHYIYVTFVTLFFQGTRKAAIALDGRIITTTISGNKDTGLTIRYDTKLIFGK